MPSPTEISVAQLSRIIGLPGAPMLVDVRPCDERGPDRHLLPTARQMKSQSRLDLGAHLFRPTRHRLLRDGGDVSQGTAAWLRHAGIDAQTLEGGFEAWRKADQPLLRTDRLPQRDASRPDDLGHASTAEDHSNCLPLVDPSLHRSDRRIPLRGPVGGSRRCEAVHGNSIRQRRRHLERSR